MPSSRLSSRTFLPRHLWRRFERPAPPRILLSQRRGAGDLVILNFTWHHFVFWLLDKIISKKMIWNDMKNGVSHPPVSAGGFCHPSDLHLSHLCSVHQGAQALGILLIHLHFGLLAGRKPWKLLKVTTFAKSMHHKIYDIINQSINPIKSSQIKSKLINSNQINLIKSTQIKSIPSNQVKSTQINSIHQSSSSWFCDKKSDVKRRLSPSHRFRSLRARWQASSEPLFTAWVSECRSRMWSSEKSYLRRKKSTWIYLNIG